MTSQSAALQIGQLQGQYAVELDKIKKAHKKYQTLISANSQLDTQMNENSMVKEELDLVKDDNAVIYKFSGPILVRQTLAEARANVDNRIKYIESEIKKNKELLDTYKNAVDTERENLTKIEEQLQKLLAKNQVPGS